MCSIRGRTNSFAALCNWIRELSNPIKSSLIRPTRLQYGKNVGIRELSSSITEVSNWIRELSNSIGELSNAIWKLFNSIEELSMSIGEIIQLKNYLIEFEGSLIVSYLELFNWIGELYHSIR